MSATNPAFTDASTNAVLATRAYLDGLSPDSKAGQELVAELRCFGPGDEDAWRDELACLLEAEAWCEAEPSGEEHLRGALAELPLLERPLRKLRVGEVLGEAGLFTVKRFLYYGGEALQSALDLVEGWGVVESTPEQIYALMDVIHPQKRATPRFHLASELSDELDELRIELRRKKKQERRLRGELEEAIVADHGGTFDIHGTFLPPTDYDKAALADDERLEQTAAGWKPADQELQATVAEIAQLEAEIETIEYDLRARLSERLREEADWLEELAQTLALLDLRLAKVRLRRDIDGCWPQLTDQLTDRPGMLIEAGKEPAVVRDTGRDDVQPVDVELGAEPVVVTGPNMGGKSVLLRLVGICQWAAQHAMPAPAARCEYSPVGAIIYVGSEEPRAGEQTQGLSSFGREVQRLVEWWDDGTRPRLWLLDELGRGTHPDEGAAIASEVIETLADGGDRVLAATHFPAVAALQSAKKLRIAGLTDPAMLEALLARHVDVRDALRQAMDYRPVRVESSAEAHDVPRDARVVARALGLDLSNQT